MPADQPAGPERRPWGGVAGSELALDDLRERLGRLPADHPSAPGDRPRPEPEAADQAGEPPGSGEPVPVPKAARERERSGLPDQAARIDRLAKLLGPGERAGPAGPPGRPGSGVADAPGAVSPLASPERHETYRPWFSEPDQPWFSPDRGDHSG
jgi:hypothetical protein